MPPTNTNTTTPARDLDHPVFSQPQPTADPTTFKVHHASDGAAYKSIDALNKAHKLTAIPFPAPRGQSSEPVLTLAQVLGSGTAAAAEAQRIQKAKQIVFHSGGDCGSTKGPTSQNEVTDKLVSDFNEEDPMEVPAFHILLGDIVYSFGEVEYYYDQFYEPYRSYPAPILAVAGNHDGMVSPLARATALDGYLRNFCADGFVVRPEAGGLSRTAQIQPGVFFTFEAPFVRIIALYSNALEDPGVISDKNIGSSQLDFLEAALTRAKTDNFTGAILLAHHHPPYTISKHGWSVDMQAQIDKVCTKVGIWPHADLAGHAHNYQRFTRTRSNGQQVPYIVCGNIGHGIQKLNTTMRAPQIIQAKSATADQVVLENYDDKNYDDKNYGYLRVIVDATQLRIEYHPASDGTQTKTPDDQVCIDLVSRQIVHYNANDLGLPDAAAKIQKKRASQSTSKPKAATKTKKKR